MIEPIRLYWLRRRMHLAEILALALVMSPAMFGGEAIAPAGEARIYKSVDGLDLKLYVVWPADWNARDQRAAILFFHGGSWVHGDPNQFNEHCIYFASRGLVCVQVGYRLLSKQSTAPPIVCVEDARSAVRWVRRHASELGVDPQRIASAGGSTGGQLAAHIGMIDGLDDPGDDRRISAKSNAMVLFNPALDNGPGGFGAERIGKRYLEFSPAHNVSRDDPPAILFLGPEDNVISLAAIEKFKRAMENAGVRCDLRIYAGQGHAFFNFKAENPKYYSLTVIEADKFLASLGWLQGTPTLMAPLEN